MTRYFMELAYMGGPFAGFQVQNNAVTVQSEVEKALHTFFRHEIALTGSSRTDTGVHARQNYFHFDFEGGISEKAVYNLNAIVHPAIVIKRIVAMQPSAHSRFDAISREYEYTVLWGKDPFRSDRSYRYPFPLELTLLREAAEIVKGYSDFASFSKRGSQVRTTICSIERSEWEEIEGGFVYRVRGSRFLRGMVRGLVGTMLKVGRKKWSIEEFKSIIEMKDATKADFSVPGHGLSLIKVNYEEGYFERGGKKV
ncbi:MULTISPECIES: tRNA pseudouridine(38-40) synthase TruA [unclassified Paraflavitalea]|uniref:tRNA pseudouridine(38-40) synthase TruA n=1 Tax=unclassified Paraflavitalea TaxID=2798305 RepID=UPI003D3316EF